MSLEFWAIAAVAALMLTGILIPIAFSKRLGVGWSITITTVCFAAALVIGIGMTVRQSTQFHDWCTQAGGHVLYSGENPICITSDGRIIGS